MTANGSSEQAAELRRLNGVVSKGPWRMERDEKSGNFIIFDKDFHAVASNVFNENDAIFIVNLVNWARGRV